MIKHLYHYVTLSVVGFIKVSLLFLLFGTSIFFIVNSKDISTNQTLAFTGLLTSPGNKQNLHTRLPNINNLIESEFDLTKEKKHLSPEEAEVLLFISRLSDNISSSDALKLAKTIVGECNSYDLDPFLILAVIHVESEFTPQAVSNKGAIGLMQVMPNTGKYVANQMGISYSGSKSLYDPFVNVKLGIHYLSFLTDRFSSTENALAAYNYGPANFAKNKRLATNPPRYVKKVLKFKSFLEEESILLAKRS